MMNSSKTLLIILAVIILGVGIWFGISKQESPMGEIMSDEEITTGEMEMPTQDADPAIKETEVIMEDSGQMMETAGTYEEYSAEKIALAGEGKVVIFFHATWCPTCRAADKNITENITSIPAGVHILKANYDNETALRQKYGVTTQHTFVQVDADGEMITKFSGQRKLSDILSSVQ